jgi:hypothetical protein
MSLRRNAATLPTFFEHVEVRVPAFASQPRHDFRPYRFPSQMRECMSPPVVSATGKGEIKEQAMRKSLVLSIAAAGVILLSSAFAARFRDNPAAPAELGTGAGVGTVGGIGLYEGWWGTSAAMGGAALPTTAVGAATVNGEALSAPSR